jgi:RNase P/RNase MRP subunit p30
MNRGLSKKMTEFFVPKDGNEEELAKAALEKEIDDFVFLYVPADSAAYKRCEKKSAYRCGVLFDGKYTVSDLIKAKRISDHIVVKANEDIRKILESVKDIFVYGCESAKRPDFIHHRNSGLNHILLNIAKKNRIKFLMDFSYFLGLEKLGKAVALGRLRQNILLCRKFKTEVNIASFARNRLMIKKDINILKILLGQNRTV